MHFSRIDRFPPSLHLDDNAGGRLFDVSIACSMGDEKVYILADDTWPHEEGTSGCTRRRLTTRRRIDRLPVLAHPGLSKKKKKKKKK